jgi:hypothetical protein
MNEDLPFEIPPTTSRWYLRVGLEKQPFATMRNPELMRTFDP